MAWVKLFLKIMNKVIPSLYPKQPSKWMNERTRHNLTTCGPGLVHLGWSAWVTLHWVEVNALLSVRSWITEPEGSACPVSGRQSQSEGRVDCQFHKHLMMSESWEFLKQKIFYAFFFFFISTCWVWLLFILFYIECDFWYRLFKC